MLVVFVVNLEVGVSLLAPPVGHDVEWTGVGPGLRNYLVFQNINIEIGSLQVMQSSVQHQYNSVHSYSPVDLTVTV